MKRSRNPDLTLPTATELATIAAAGSAGAADADPEKTLPKALALYFRAKVYLDDLREREMADIVPDLGDESLFHRYVIQPEVEGASLILDPKSEGSDPVRDYLDHHKLRLKTARAVLENLRAFCIARSLKLGETESQGEAIFEKFLQDAAYKENGEEVYRLGRVLLDRLVVWKSSKKSEVVRKGHQTRKEKGSSAPSS